MIKSIDIIEKSKFDNTVFNSEGLNKFNSAFSSELSPINGMYSNTHQSMERNISGWLGVNDINQISMWKTSVFSTIKQMLNGVEMNGKKTLGINDVSKWKINPKMRLQNLKQHSGYTAEIISTAKENLIHKSNNDGLTTYRTADLPNTFDYNDQYVDKVVVDHNNRIVKRVQTKFVGKDGSECLTKLASKKYNKYFTGDEVDIIEIPKDYYDEIRNNDLISNKVTKLENQLERVNAEGKTDVAQDIENKINRYKEIDQKIEASTVSSDEAMYATKHPKRYAAKVFVEDIVSAGHETGVKSGLMAAGISATVSVVDNISKYTNGEITAEEMAKDIAIDTASAGVLGYGTAFVSTAVSRAMSHSANTLIQNVGGTCLPAAAVSFAVDSYEAVSDFAQGQIDGNELAYELGESASSVSGSMAGGAIGMKIGAAVGTAIAPGVGTTIGGITGSLVGGMVGCVVTSEIYATAVELGAEGVDAIAEQAEKFAKDTIDIVKENLPEKLESVKSAFSDFISTNKLPFKI